MIGWINRWAGGIVVAIIIATIIEMILPEGNNKKYVKTVIGVYLLFCIVAPVVSQLVGQDVNWENILDLKNYEKEGKTQEVSTSSLVENNQKTIQQLYEEKMKQDMQSKIQEKGYAVQEINLSIADDENYTIQKIEIRIEKKIEMDTQEKVEETETNSIPVIEEVKVQIGEEERKTEKTENQTEQILSKQEIKELKKYLSDCYQVKEKNITIS